MATRKTKNKKETEQESKHRAHNKRIYRVFHGMGFSYISTGDHEMHIGSRRIEIDSMYVYENLWLLIEDDVKEKSDMDHVRVKEEAYQEIKNNKSEFRNKLIELFPDKDLLKKYSLERLKLFYIYIPLNGIELSEEEKSRYSDIVFMQPDDLEYFRCMVDCIHFSAITEMFRYLNVKKSDIGNLSSSNESSIINAPIIIPKEMTGLDNEVRVVSFMMCAEDLLDTCYVLRKDNWQESMWLYQRLLIKSKLQNIRSFLRDNGSAFYNNVIVALPNEVRFIDESGDYHKINEINTIDGHYRLSMPKEYNSICIIDGQHRIFAHYNSGERNKEEEDIEKLRKQLHILVTGLIFPEGMSESEKAKIESKIFLDINSNAKPVSQNVLLQIKRINNPLADESLAQYVIERMNSNGPFKGLLQISSLHESKIKTASIVRFALKYIVKIDDNSDGTLYHYWDGSREELLHGRDSVINEYISYSVSVLNQYFSAIKSRFRDEWNDENSKLLSVISINGFLLAFQSQLHQNGVKPFEFYRDKFKDWNFDFSKEGFPYTSSQYRKFSNRILREVFELKS